MWNWLVIIDELSLDDILQKIYFEAYSYEDLKDYVFSALRKVASLDEFLDLLYTTIRDYSLVSLFQICFFKIFFHFSAKEYNFLIESQRAYYGQTWWSDHQN